VRKTFDLLLDKHDEMRSTLRNHQRALLALDLRAARAHFRALDRMIRAHIRLEDTRLLPIYRRRAGRVEGGSPDLFLAEHRRIERFLSEIRARMARLKLTADTALDLLDFEWLFKQLLDHHDRRERSFLYPILERVMTSYEFRKLYPGRGR
jgi:hemerythrin-like domain-containing protein